MMNLGTFTYGDSGRDLQITLKGSTGTALNLTGATSIVLVGVCAKASGDLSLSVAGTLLDAANGILGFEDVGTTATQPDAKRGVDVYQCHITYLLTAETYKTDLFALSIRRFPS